MDQIKVQIPNQNQPIQDYLSGCTVINKQSAFLGTTILLWEAALDRLLKTLL